MGELPDWYIAIRAARYLGVAPWALMAQPQAWVEWALSAEHAEDEARAHHHKLQDARAKARRKGRP